MKLRSTGIAILVALAGTLAFGADTASTPPKVEAPPKLVLVVVVDQFRYDYLTRFHDDFRGGIARMVAEGASFTGAHLSHYPTVTAIGHATVLTGAPPAISGIVGNDWFDRSLGRNVKSVNDDTVRCLGAPDCRTSSPRRLLVSTLGDELKTASRGLSKVVGLSLKDRAAILSVGHGADGAYWLDWRTGRFVSSDYYVPELPEWVEEFNARRLPESYAGRQWLPLDGNADPLATIPKEPPGEVVKAFAATPFANEVLAELARAAVAGEQLGQRGVTDLLLVSFSTNDYVGHDYGPHSPQMRDITLRTDLILGSLLDRLDEALGLKHVLVVFTSDHGISPVPEEQIARGMPGGRMSSNELFDSIEVALDAAFGEARWILGTAGSSPYLDHELIRSKGLDPTLVRRVAAEAAATVPHVARVFTRDQLLAGQVPPDSWSQRVLRGYHRHRSGDLEVLFEPFWFRGDDAATHGSAYSYDTHIPLIFMGPGIRSGRYHQSAVLNDLAPTLAVLLEVETPSGSTGRVLREIFAETRSGETIRPGDTIRN